MTTTVQIGRARLADRPIAWPKARGAAIELAQVVAIAAGIAIVARMATVSLVAVLRVASGGSPAAVAGVMALTLPFVAIATPTTGIWLVGAIQTGRTIRRLAGRIERDDRAAFTDLNALLARE